MRRLRAAVPFIVAALIVLVMTMQTPSTEAPEATPSPSLVSLPSPLVRGGRSLDEALAQRRSARDFAPRGLTQGQLGQLLWAAQGVTDPEGRRTAPSAGGLYPLEVYAATVDGLFHYLPAEHALRPLLQADVRAQLQAAAFDQAAVGDAPLVIVLTGMIARTEVKYGERAARYVDLEAGHAAQNVLLEATALDLVALPVGSFDDQRVRAVLRAPVSETPLYLLPVGWPA